MAPCYPGLNHADISSDSQDCSVRRRRHRNTLQPDDLRRREQVTPSKEGRDENKRMPARRDRKVTFGRDSGAYSCRTVFAATGI